MDSVVSQIPEMVANTSRALIRRLTAPSTTPLLPFVPKWIKVLFLTVMFLNSSSWPFLWHLRVWYYPLRAYFLAYTLGQKGYWRKWRKEYLDNGGIKDMRVKVWRRALFDDCDYNMHLSNSCYAKNSDAAKMKFAIDAFAPCFRTGLHMALGASHWKYMKEIPIGSDYLMETRLGGWGDKWLHIVTEFVIYPKKKGGKKGGKTIEAAPKEDKQPLIPNLSNPASGSDTPIMNGNGDANGHAGSGHDYPSTPAEEVIRRLVAKNERKPRADGGIVTCIAVTDYCFKQGRVTIPPRIAMYLSLLSESDENRKAALAILDGKDRGAKFAAGGWRSHPDADKFGTDVGTDENGTQDWALDGRRAMESVSESLSRF